MTEFTARKLGEVLAFSQVGAETMEKGRPAFESVFGAEKVNALIAGQNDHAAAITKGARDAGMADATMAKAAATGTKLRAMRDMYVGDQWDNAAELLEWSGFFEGAAVVHFSLVQGSGEALANEEIKGLGAQGMSFHNDILQAAIKAIAEYAKKKESVPAA